MDHEHGSDPDHEVVSTDEEVDRGPPYRRQLTDPAQRVQPDRSQEGPRVNRFNLNQKSIFLKLLQYLIQGDQLYIAVCFWYLLSGWVADKRKW